MKSNHEDTTLIPQSHLTEGLAGLPKPKLGEPCNGCGYCCTVEPCMLAQEIMGCTDGPCVALEVDGDKKVCGLVKRPAWYMFGEDRPPSETGRISVLFANALGIGRGCDADDTPANVKGKGLRRDGN